MIQHPIYPCLWFDGQARGAAALYGEAFGDGRITGEGPVTVSFTLDGQRFLGLNGGPQFRPNPSLSFYVTRERREEVDHAWQVLSEGGGTLMPLDKYPWSDRYGWVQDRFDVSWQIALGRRKDVGQKFAPMLMFTGARAGRAEEAIGFYTSLFEPSAVVGILNNGPGDQEREGTVKHAQFWLGRQVFMAMDSSGPHEFGFSEGVSLVVTCETQEEIDASWSRLTEGGQESMGGWLKDRFGVSWQVIPRVLEELLNDPARAPRVTQAFLQMRKFDIERLLKA